MANPTYVGNCTWAKTRISAEKTDLPNEVATSVEAWSGRSDQTDAFRLLYYIGKEYLGGYIVDNALQPESPGRGMDAVNLKILRPPSFSAFLASTSTTVKTSQISATIVTALVFDSATSVDATRSASYEAPETTYIYFAPRRPNAARFTQVFTTATTRVTSSSISAKGDDGSSAVYGGNAPAVLVAALTMPEADVLTSFQAEPIPGTPWYKCTDVIVLELVGN
jgi:hypothetical protein